MIFVFARRSAPPRATDVSPAALTPGAGAPSDADKQLADNAAQQAQLESEALSHIKLPETTRKTEALAKHIRDSVHKDPVNVTNVMRTWIADTETKRT